MNIIGCQSFLQATKVNAFKCKTIDRETTHFISFDVSSYL